MSEANMIWNYSMEEIIRGYGEKDDQFNCILCGAGFVKGNIYNFNGSLFDAYGAVRQHVTKEHGRMVDYLLKHKPDLMGISDVQRQILSLMSDGRTDKEISAEMGIAQSTVRNHRFKLREREKQAILFLAMMRSLEEKTNRNIRMTDDQTIEELHPTATMVDDRYTITDQEREKTMKTYMDENGVIKQFPAREKKKIILLKEIMNNFKRNVEYSETEINLVLKRIYEEDYASIRRALIEYGFMDRSDDCKIYRVKE